MVMRGVSLVALTVVTELGWGVAATVQGWVVLVTLMVG